MANKNAEKKTAAVVCALKEDSHLPRPQSKKDNQQDSKKDIKKDSQKNNIAAADRHKDSNHSFLFLLLFLTVLFFSVYYYISPNFFKEEIKQPSPSPELVNDKMSEQERKEKEKEVQRLNEDLSKSISDQVQETLKKFDEKENSKEFRKYLLLLKEGSNTDKKDAKLNKKVLLDFEKEKKSCRENLVTRAKSLQTKLETDFEILLRSKTDEKLDIFEKEALILRENCQKDLTNLIKKVNDSYDKLSAKIKSEAEKVENLNKLQKDKEEARRITGRFYNYTESKTQEILAKINRDFGEEVKDESRQKHKEIIYNFELRKFKLLDKITSYHYNLKKKFEKDLDDLLKKRNSDNFEEKAKELFESYKKKLSDFAKEAIDENYKIIKIMQKNISQVEELTQGGDGENIDDEPWTYSALVPLGMALVNFPFLYYASFFINKIRSVIEVVSTNDTANVISSILIFLFLVIFLDFFLLAIKKCGKKNYFERFFDLLFKHLLPKFTTLLVLFFIKIWFFPDLN